jgi:phospholipase D1/2
LCSDRQEQVTSFMKPAPFPNEDETKLKEDAAVADPLADDTIDLWNNTARQNREIFTEIFRPVPSNLVQNFDAYQVRSLSFAAGEGPY